MVEIVVTSVRSKSIKPNHDNLVNTLDSLGLFNHILRHSKFPDQYILDFNNIRLRFMTYEKFDRNYRWGFRGVVMSDVEFEKKLYEYYKTHQGEPDE